jgi:hypothetical protein
MSAYVGSLTQEQARVLLHKHLTGEFPGQRWPTVESLFKKELIARDDTGKRIVLTPAGKAWCDKHHMEVGI